MATIAEFVITAHEFPLGSITEELPSATVELERIIPTKQAIIPYFWVRGVEDPLDGERAARLVDHTGIKQIELVDQADEAYLLRAEWNPQYEGLMKAITTSELVLMSGSGNAEQWTFELRADEHTAIAEFQQYCRDHDIKLVLTSLQRLSELQAGADYNLTPSQREALVLAYERRYYESPRQVTLAELAEELDITGQSVGSRLRRGTHRLIGATLIDDPDHPG